MNKTLHIFLFCMTFLLLKNSVSAPVPIWTITFGNTLNGSYPSADAACQSQNNSLLDNRNTADYISYCDSSIFGTPIPPVNGLEVNFNGQSLAECSMAINCVAPRTDSSRRDIYGVAQMICPGGGITQDYKTCFCPQSDASYAGDTCSIPWSKIIAGDGNKNNGPSCPYCGDPINPANGNVFEHVIDFSEKTGGLSIGRIYNSNPFNPDVQNKKIIGARWTSNFDMSIRPEAPRAIDANVTSCWQSVVDNHVFCTNPSVDSNSSLGASQEVSVLRPNGNRYFFKNVGGLWTSDSDVSDQLNSVYSADGQSVDSWEYKVASSDNVENYDKNGLLISVISRSGTTQKITYSDGNSNDTNAGRTPISAPVCSHVQTGNILAVGTLLCVTDNWGRQINFEYDPQGRLGKIIGNDGLSVVYLYDGASGGCSILNPASPSCSANNLTQVIYSDGGTITYYYDEASNINEGSACSGLASIGSGLGPFPNILTGMVDENQKRFSDWKYDCYGRAINSSQAGAVSNVSLSYRDPDADGSRATKVDSVWGTPDAPQLIERTYNFQEIIGVLRASAIDLPCIECGAIASRSYDTHGNLTSTSDWDGNRTNYSFDPLRNVEISRMDSVGTAQMRMTTTLWHSNYRLPLKIAEPTKRTTFDYDSSGNLVSKTEQGTTDANGSSGFNMTVTGIPRKWTYTYNAVGQVLTATGPRTDISDVTRYVYDTMGNLITVTNAAGQVTTLSNYDANGRVGRIAAPNGVTTDLTYTPRGWLSGRVVTSGSVVETTTYAYDGVGQLVKVTLPDTSSIDYTYDDAHRLTAVSDSLGNSIHYTLDLVGNRVGEQVADSCGALAQQVSRVYDQLNRLQQQTGIVQ